MLTARVTAVLIALSIAAPALAQSTMVRGKVIDAKQQPVPNVTITVESTDGSGRKLTTKTDKKGEFVQLLTASGMTLEEALIGATLNAAASIDRQDAIGSLEAGKQFDAVIVSGMLTDLIRVGGPVVKQVIKRGRLAHGAV